jgi:threonine dehydrogenase-like Zn-dependent dehydrogenase
VPGHEFFGRIAAIGARHPRKDELCVGDRVIPEQVVPCTECRYCKEGQYHMCQPHNVFGFKHYLNGGFARYALLPENAIVHKNPDSVGDEKAVLIEPFACAMHAVDRADIREGDVVVLAGAGPLGLGMVAAARLRKPGKLIVLDLTEGRLKRALGLGADLALNPQKDDVGSILSALTGGYGCDIYIEATGHPSAVQQGLALLRKQGRFVEFSVFSEPATVDWSIIGDGKELEIRGVSLSPGCYEKVIADFEDGTLSCEGVLTHILPLERFKEAFQACRAPDAVKVALRP